MKTSLISSVIIIGFFLVGCGGNSDSLDDNSTPQALGQTIYTAVKNNDADLFAKYFITEADINWQDTQAGEMDNTAKRYDQKALEYFQKNYQERLERIRTRFAENGLNDWANTQYTTVTYNSGKRYGKVDIARFYKVEFKDGDKTGKIDLGIAIKIGDQWEIGKVPSYNSYR
ncbi:MAG: hypothetical protein WBA74_02540 [Cyclobacteriaceae bacterium]